MASHEGGVVASRVGCDDTRNVIPQAVLYCTRRRAQQDAEIGAPRRFRHRGSGVSGTVPHTIWTATFWAVLLRGGSPRSMWASCGTYWQLARDLSVRGWRGGRCGLRRLSLRERTYYGHARPAAPGRHRSAAVPGTAGPYGDPGCRGAGRHAAGAFGIAERANGNLGGDGDPAVEGLRLDARNVAGDADGVRSLAGPQPPLCQVDITSCKSYFPLCRTVTAVSAAPAEAAVLSDAGSGAFCSRWSEQVPIPARTLAP